MEGTAIPHIDEIRRLMSEPARIRNIGLLAHIDHGKTTLSDHLLAAGGVIGREFAGSALYLDYLEEEQKRNITIKTSAISLPVKVEKEKYLINLVDTPGHIDFSGKVSRALRLIDGCLVVVDAVEGIMAQTESVVRLALEEWCRPLLFINKVDRLFRLSFSSKKIRQQFEEIISNFNQLIELFGTEKQQSWKVKSNREQILFGSALEGWGFSQPQLLGREMKFKDVITLHREDPQQLPQTFPLQTLLSSIVCRKLPSPVRAQKYRIRPLWEGGTPPKEIVKCKKGLTVAYISKTKVKAGRIFATGRVLSGNLQKGKLLQLNSGEEELIEGLSVLLGEKREVVRNIPRGNIFGAFIDAKCGKTYAEREIPGSFRSPFYVAVPVIYEAIEPLETRNFDQLLAKLRKKTQEDPNLSVRVSEESGRILLGGVGELHLELTLKEIREEMEIDSSEPKVAYREIMIEGGIARRKGLVVRISPITGKKEKGERRESLERLGKGNQITIEGFSSEQSRNLKESVEKNLKRGPIASLPIIGARVDIKKKKNNKIETTTCLNAFFDALSSSKTELYEPVYQFNILTGTENLGDIQSEIARRGGKIEEIKTSAGSLLRIRGEVPVRQSIGIASDIRAKTHGKANLQLKFHGYTPVEKEEREEIIEKVTAI